MQYNHIIICTTKILILIPLIEIHCYLLNILKLSYIIIETKFIPTGPFPSEWKKTLIVKVVLFYKKSKYTLT